MKLENLTYEDVQKYLKNNDILIIPIGSLEQHGPMSPLGTDSIIAEEIANRIGDELDLFVSPVIKFGFVYPDFQRFPGTLCVREITFSNLLEDIIRNYQTQGFRKFLLINTHETNKPLIKYVAWKLGKELPIKTLSSEYWYLLDNELKEITESELIHACEDEISIMMYIRPELVENERTVDEMPKEAEIEKNYLLYPLPDDYKTKSGVMGKPSLANREKGEKIMKLIVQKTINLLKELKWCL